MIVLKNSDVNCAIVRLNVYLFDCSGLGYIVGSNVAKVMGHWQWALRVSHSNFSLTLLELYFPIYIFFSF